MKFKESLKPDKFKIAVVVIIILTYILVFSTFTMGPTTPSPLQPLYVFLVFPGGVLSLYASSYQLVGFIAILINLLYWYILACIIVSVARKIRTKPASSSE